MLFPEYHRHVWCMFGAERNGENGLFSGKCPQAGSAWKQKHVTPPFLLVEICTTSTNHKIIWQCWGRGESCGRNGSESKTVLVLVIAVASFESWEICDIYSLYQSLQKKAIMRLHNPTHNQPKSTYLCGGRIFFKYTALSPHKLPISAQNMQGLHDFIIPTFSLQKSHIYLSRKLKSFAFTSQKSSHFLLLPWERYEHHRKAANPVMKPWRSPQICLICQQKNHKTQMKNMQCYFTAPSSRLHCSSCAHSHLQTHSHTRCHTLRHTRTLRHTHSHTYVLTQLHTLSLSLGHQVDSDFMNNHLKSVRKQNATSSTRCKTSKTSNKKNSSTHRACEPSVSLPVASLKVAHIACFCRLIELELFGCWATLGVLTLTSGFLTLTPNPRKLAWGLKG